MVKHASRPSAVFQAGVQNLSGQFASRYTCQSAALAFFCFACGIAFGSVRIACFSAEPHLQSLVCGSSRPTCRTSLHAFAGVLRQVYDNLIDGDRVVRFMPAIVVGNHGDGRVADLGLACQFRLLQIRHSYDVHTPTAIDVRFGSELKTPDLHAQVSSAQFAIRSQFPGGARCPRQSCGQTGSAKLMWATTPPPKNVEIARACDRRTDRELRNRAEHALLSSTQPRSARECVPRPASSDQKCLRGSSVPMAPAYGRGHGARETRLPCPPAGQLRMDPMDPRTASSSRTSSSTSNPGMA